jgi:hypothetical protein
VYVNINELGGTGGCIRPPNTTQSGVICHCCGEEQETAECYNCGEDIELTVSTGELVQLKERIEQLEEQLIDSAKRERFWYDESKRQGISSVDIPQMKPSLGVSTMATCSPIYTVAIVAVKTTAVEGQSERIINTVSGILAPDATTAAFMAGMSTDEETAKLSPNERIVIRTQAM